MSNNQAEPRFEIADLLAATRAGTLETFLKAAHLSIEGPDWTVLTEPGIAAHQAGEIDLLEGLAVEDSAPLNYATQRFLEQLLPVLDIPLADMTALIARLTARTRGTGTNHFLRTGFSAWMEAEAARPFAALEAIQAGAAPTDLLNATLHVGLQIDRVRFLAEASRLLADGSSDERETAAGILGRFSGFTPEELDQVVERLEASLAKATGAAVTGPLRALLAIALRAPGRPEMGLRVLASIAGRSDAHVRAAVALEMTFDIANAPDTLAAAALALLHAIGNEEAATIDAIDHILSHDLKDRLEAAQSALLDAVLGARAVTMEQLDSVARALLTGDRLVFSATVTRWLLSDNLAHVLAVRDLCGSFLDEAPQFEIDFTGLSQVHAERIARRCCALLMLYPETIASILASLLRTGPADAVPRIEQLLFDPLLISYWTGPRTYLESILPEAPPAMGAVIARLLARHDRYKAGVEAVQDLKELRPSQHQRFLVETRRREESRAIHKAAQSQSSFADIFPTSLLLYGDSAIFDVHLGPEQVARQETPMQTHEYSQELPRLEVIDPFGAWFQRDRLLRDEDEA
ncbi:hypothetical protein BH10PSE12_BH10PSE12_07780 [soil metagenome]